MAITAAEYSAIYTINSDQQTALEATHAEGHLAHLAINPEDNPFIAGVLKEIKDLQKEIDYLRTEISANKDKATFPGFGTSSTTALVGDTTTISKAQASAITANTAKVSMVIGTGSGEAMSGQTNLVTVGTQAHQAMAGNTKIIGIGSNTTLSFGDLTETINKGKATYTILLSATRDFGGKTGVLTKSSIITLI